ncbi:hypothetical protein SLS60_001354 [Paraconiothyrium brasiliense]|uniref:Uncharacterized protein n=1 Tax=Paraconiothyrium brasiliense TaxID=300254 RepID=A0ABR3SAD1_9PLEO
MSTRYKESELVITPALWNNPVEQPRNLAYFVRTHEKALANALQLQRQAPRHGQSNSVSSPTGTSSSSSTSSVWAAALSLPSLTFTSPTLKPAKLTLTPHHLFYLLSRFEDLNISVGPMNVRLENIHTDASPTNYVSFLSNAQRNKQRPSDRDSIHSVSSIRSVMSGMSSLWSSLRLSSNSDAKQAKQKAQLEEDIKYLYSAFTKIPCLRLAPDHKARLIAGYEEFPFDSAVPLHAFKNVTALEIYDVDFRQFYGWDRLADNLRSLTVKRAGVDDPADLLINIVLDDMDKRRRRSAKTASSPAIPWQAATSLAPLANTLQSLDISANLFVEIPDSLATLSCLRALNLSNCMISSLHSLGRNPLPAITTLNLRSNRLTSLAGIERLLSLERIDLRDNKLTDPTEVARLTCVPYITEVFVHRNPFCKSYSNYRVTIFNLFRKTPGYSEDIKIDSTLPSSGERKQLVDRVPELPSVPVMKPPPEDETPPPPTPPKIVKALDAADLAESPRTSLHRSKSGKSGKGSHRKKKVPKRRIVELVQGDAVQSTEVTPPPSYSTDDNLPKPKATVSADVVPRLEAPKSEGTSGDPLKTLPQLDTGVKAPGETATQDTSPPEFDITSDLYKRKIEALRQDFGNNWLSALGDEGWDAKSVTSIPSAHSGFTSPIIRPAMARTPSQGIVSGGRTLG